MRIVHPLLLLITIFPAAAVFAKEAKTLDQLVTEAGAAPLQDRPGLYIRIARLQTETADKLYEEGKADEAQAAVNDVITYSGKASEAATRSGKHLKDTEIALRKMAEKFRDLKRALAFDEQPPVQEAVDHLEKMRTDLLAVMFPKKAPK